MTDLARAVLGIVAANSDRRIADVPGSRSRHIRRRDSWPARHRLPVEDPIEARWSWRDRPTGIASADYKGPGRSSLSVVLAATASQSFGLLGAAPSAGGIALAIIGIRKVRVAVGKFRSSLFPRRATVHSMFGSVTVANVTLKGRGKVGPGPEGWPDERWHAELDNRIDQVFAALEQHGRPGLDQAIADLRDENARLRTGFDSKLAHLDTEAERSGKWGLAGLIVALLGASLQVGAMIVA